MRYVVDANVVVKTLVREPDSSVADALLDSHRHGQCSLLAPDILFAEIGNAMWKLVHLQKQITEDEARESINDVLSLGIFVTPAERLVQEALRIATSAGHPLYDCLYVALAQDAACPLITADEKLRAKFPSGPVSILSLKTFVI